MSMNPVLIVQNRQPLIMTIQNILEQHSCPYITTRTVAGGAEHLQQNVCDLMVLDYHLEKNQGQKLLEYIREQQSSTQSIVVTDSPTVQGAVEAIKLGAIDYVAQPRLEEEFALALDKILAKIKTKEDATQFSESDRIQKEVGLIGTSEQFRSIMLKAKIAACENENILIQGESGTGKELIARFIHYHRAGVSTPFIPVNCGAIPAELLESELFGHVKGAYTGADSTREGFFQAAHGGSIFLDEIGNTTLEMQTKLLRVIEDKEIWKVGERRPDRVKVDIIAATNKNLGELVRTGKFREDLYYRLNVINLVIPPLRDRGEDVVVLANHFIQEMANERDIIPPRFSDEVIQHLQKYDWPGNVRELENLVKRLVIFLDSEIIRKEDLPAAIRANKNENWGGKTALAEAEKSHIKRICDLTDWNLSHTAKLLEISRRTLYSKLRKYNLSRP